ncbi:MAG: CHAT domain-containing protein [Bacteroidota bacterium]
MFTPVIYTAYANPGRDSGNENSFLEFVEKERTELEGMLRQADTQQRIKHVSSPATTIEDLLVHLKDQLQYLTVFHYSGHANEDFLKLEDQKLEQESIASLLGLAENLQLVFLNGCSSAGKVDFLLEKGVKVVLGTQDPVEDELAGRFSANFYKHLLKSASIERAYQLAKAEVEVWHNKVGTMRELIYRREKGAFVWGLHYKDANKKSLKWRIMPVKRKLNPMQLLLDRMAEEKPEILTELKEELSRHGKESEGRVLPRVIIRNFPWPIGALVKSIQASEDNEIKLKQYASLYITGMQLLINILYSQLWQSGKRNNDLPEGVRWNATELPVNFPLQDWKTRLNSLIQFFQKENSALFIPELGTLFSDYPEFESICEWFQQKIKAWSQSDWEMGRSEFFQELEGAAQRIYYYLGALAFFSKYELKSIKAIKVKKPRHDDPTYRHVIHNLNTTNPDEEIDTIKEDDSFFDSESIYLFPAGFQFTPEAMDNYKEVALNLTPFLIDKNAFKERRDISDIFSCVYTDGYNYLYFRVDRDIFVTLEPYKNYEGEGLTEFYTAYQDDHLSTEEENYDELIYQWEDWLTLSA